MTGRPSPAPVPSDMAPLSLCSLEPIQTSPSLSFSNLGKQKGSALPSKMCFGEVMGWLLLLSVSSGNHPQVWSFWYFKNPLSLGILKPAGISLHGALPPSLLSGTLEGTKISGSQIKVKVSKWLSRKEKSALHCGWKTPLSQWIGDAGSWSMNFFTTKVLRVVMLIRLPSQAEDFSV